MFNLPQFFKLIFKLITVVFLLNLCVCILCAGRHLPDVILDKVEDLYHDHEWDVLPEDSIYLNHGKTLHKSPLALLTQLPIDFDFKNFYTTEGIWMLIHESELIGENGWDNLIKESRSKSKTMTISFFSNMFPLESLSVRFCLGGKAQIQIRGGANHTIIDTISVSVSQQHKKYDWIEMQFNLPSKSSHVFTVESRVTEPNDFVLIDKIVGHFVNSKEDNPRYDNEYDENEGLNLETQGGVDVTMRWPGGDVPFQIMNSIEKRTMIRIRFAMALIETYTDNWVRFIPMSPAQIAKSHPYHLRIVKSGEKQRMRNSTCWADVGFIKNHRNFSATYQEAGFDRTCSKRSIVYELMRVLGRFPEPMVDQKTDQKNHENSTKMGHHLFLTDGDAKTLIMMYKPLNEIKNKETSSPKLQIYRLPNIPILGAGPNEFANPNYEDR